MLLGLFNAPLPFISGGDDGFFNVVTRTGNGEFYYDPPSGFLALATEYK